MSDTYRNSLTLSRATDFLNLFRSVGSSVKHLVFWNLLLKSRKCLGIYKVDFLAFFEQFSMTGLIIILLVLFDDHETFSQVRLCFLPLFMFSLFFLVIHRSLQLIKFSRKFQIAKEDDCFEPPFLSKLEC